MEKEDYLFIGFVLVVLLLFVAAIALDFVDDSDPRWECDTNKHIGWEREEQYWYTTWQKVGDVQVPIHHYRWVRIRELGEKEYNIYCLGVEA